MRLLSEHILQINQNERPSITAVVSLLQVMFLQAWLTGTLCNPLNGAGTRAGCPRAHCSLFLPPCLSSASPSVFLLHEEINLYYPGFVG